MTSLLVTPMNKLEKKDTLSVLSPTLPVKVKKQFTPQAPAKLPSFTKKKVVVQSAMLCNLAT